MMVNLEPIIAPPSKEPKKFGVADIESMNWTTFLCVGAYDGKIFEWWKSNSEFLDYVKESDVEIWFAHFGGKFDFMFFLQEIVMVRKDIIVRDMIPRGSGLLCMDVIFLDEKKREVRKVTFTDSSALLPFGLKNLCESFKVEHPKLDWDHSQTTGVTKELVNYLEMDCRGLYEVIEKFYAWPLITESGRAVTMASQALKVYRTFLRTPIHSLVTEVDEFVRKSYFGGRTEIFKPLFIGDGNEELYCYDVNSLYPYVMKENEYPVSFERWTGVYEPDEIGFYEATVEVPLDMKIPPLPTVQEVSGTHKLIFPVGTFSGLFSTAELNYAKSVGVKIKRTGKGAIFKNGGKIFTAYIDTLYSMRMEAKKNNDGVTDLLTKLLMNSTYGRFGLNRERENLVFDEGQEGVEFHTEISLGKDENGIEEVIRLMSQKKHLDKTFSNVAVAAWVTSQARILMHKLYMLAPDEIYYTDTDSLFTTFKMPTGEGLGALKHEYSCKQACFLLPKTYVADKCSEAFTAYSEKGESFKQARKLTMKGFDKKKISHFTFEDFYTALEGDMRMLKVSHDAKFATFKSAIRQNTFLTMLPKSDKQIRSIYDKRKIVRKGRDWDSDPLIIRS